MVKSGMRLIGCILCIIFQSLTTLAVFLGVAEILGIIEEQFDGVIWGGKK